MPEPVGAVTVIVPVTNCTVWLGQLVVGAAGVAGCVLMTTLADATEVHPAALVTVYCMLP